MKTFDSTEDLVMAVTSDLFDDRMIAIGVDGWDGAGKTTLARNIASTVGGEVISLDDYRGEERAMYVGSLRLDEIRARASEIRCPFVLEGVCLLAAADRIGITVEKLIYVKHIDSLGRWEDEKECTTKDSEVLIGKIERGIALVLPPIITAQNNDPSKGKGDDGLPEWRKEMIRYHANYSPLVRADYVFNRRELRDSLLVVKRVGE